MILIYKNSTSRMTFKRFKHNIIMLKLISQRLQVFLVLILSVVYSEVNQSVSANFQ